MSQNALVYVGCQGWRYSDWRVAAPPATPFYPSGLAAAAELAHYSRTFDLVKVDSTFYAVPQPKVVRNWSTQVPAHFRFSCKLPRTLTHEYRLARGRSVLSAFCDGMRQLEAKLAALLIQLPPSFGVDEFATLERFLPHLPADLPFAIEFRDTGWYSERTVELLRAHRVALSLGDTPWLATDFALPLLEKLPTDWLYLRFMGAKDGSIEHFTHRQRDRSAILRTWAGAIKALIARQVPVYALLDNHFEGFSPASATLLIQALGLAPRSFPADQPQPPAGGQLGLEL